MPYTDSIPMLVISGAKQERNNFTHLQHSQSLRQLGEQEADIVSMVKGITKYAVLVTDPLTIRYHLERAFSLASSGRPGPTWIDIPVDVSSTMIDPPQLKGYDPKEDLIEVSKESLAETVSVVIEKLRSAKRPVILAGSGVRLAHSVELFERVIRKLGIPVTTAWTAHDLIPSDDPLFCGRPGSIGDRAGNFVVQKSDVLLVLGSRLNIRQVSYNWKDFARDAFKIQVDIDNAELIKPLVRCDLPILCDIKQFLAEMEGSESTDRLSILEILLSGLLGAKRSKCAIRMLRKGCVPGKPRSIPTCFSKSLYGSCLQTTLWSAGMEPHA